MPDFDPHNYKIYAAKPSDVIASLSDNLTTNPKATDEKRYEALRLAADHIHATPDEVVKRAQAYFEFLKGE
jgi:hypothetical protein